MRQALGAACTQKERDALVSPSRSRRVRALFAPIDLPLQPTESGQMEVKGNSEAQMK